MAPGKRSSAPRAGIVSAPPGARRDRAAGSGRRPRSRPAACCRTPGAPVGTAPWMDRSRPALAGPAPTVKRVQTVRPGGPQWCRAAIGEAGAAARTYAPGPRSPGRRPPRSGRWQPAVPPGSDRPAPPRRHSSCAPPGARQDRPASSRRRARSRSPACCRTSAPGGAAARMAALGRGMPREGRPRRCSRHRPSSRSRVRGKSHVPCTVKYDVCGTRFPFCVTWIG